MTLENVDEKSEVVRALSFGVVDEDYLFSFEFVSGINPRLMSPVSFQCRFSMSLIPIQPISCPRSILARILSGQIGTPKGKSFALVFLVHVLEAAVVLGVDPSVVVVLVSYPDLEFTRMVL